MTRRVTAFFATAVAVSALSQAAGAAQTSLPEAGKLSFAGTGGIEYVVDGDVHGGEFVVIEDLGILNPDLDGVLGELSIEARSWDDIYDLTYRYDGEIGYGLDTRSETYLSFNYAEASAEGANVGSVFVPDLDATLPVLGFFGDYEAYEVTAGYRRFFETASFIHPYAGLQAGARFVDSIEATFIIPDAAIVLPNTRFYDDSTVFTVGGNIGVLFALTPNLSVGVESGIHYATDLSDDDADLTGLGLAAINDEGSRLSIPVTGRVLFRF